MLRKIYSCFKKVIAPYIIIIKNLVNRVDKTRPLQRHHRSDLENVGVLTYLFNEE
jgi:hypothetical protein